MKDQHFLLTLEAHSLSQLWEILNCREREIRKANQDNADLRQQAQQLIHDIRTPIANFLEILDQDDDFLRNACEETNSIRSEARRQLEALQIYLVDAFHDPLHDLDPIRMIRPDQILHEAIAMLRPPLGVAISFVGDFSEIQVPVPAFRCVWLNLIDNALQAIPRTGGELRFEVQRDERTWICTIHDNGPGLPKEVRSILSGTSKPGGHDKDRTRGFGFGSRTVRRLVEEDLGGKISVNGEDGQGSSISIAIKLPPDHHQGVPLPPGSDISNQRK